MTRISASTTLTIAPGRGNSVLLASTYRRARTLAQWQAWHSGTHTAREFWTEIGNAAEFLEGDTMIIPGSISDLGGTECLSYWRVDSVKGSSVYCYATETLIYAQPGEPGEPGEPGGTGPAGVYVPWPRLWEDYPAGYGFQTGDAEAGETRQDVVLVKDANGELVQCLCIQAHVKSDSRKPSPTGNTAWWRAGSRAPFMTLDTLVALNAFIRHLSVGGVIMTDADGNILFRAEGGEVECNTGRFSNVRVSGEVTAGDAEGQRVALEPEGRRVAIYDADGNVCAVLSGRDMTLEEAMPGSGATLSPLSGKGSLAAYPLDGGSATETVRRLNMTGKTARGKLSLTATVSVTMTGSGTARTASGTGSTGETVGGKPTAMKGATVHCIVSTWDTAGSVLLARSRVWMAGWDELADGSTHTVTRTRSFSVAVPEGRHTVDFELTASGDTANATAELTVARLVTDAFLTELARNGLVLTKDTLNYLIALVGADGKMGLHLGGTLTRDSVPQPRVVYAARVTDSSASASSAPTRTELTKLPGAAVTLSKGASAAEGYTLTFPGAYGLTEGNAGFRVTGFGAVAGTTQNPAKATVRSVSVSGGVMTVRVWISDDDSTNYGGFFIEVLRYD